MAQSGLEYVPVNKIDDVTDLEDVETLSEDMYKYEKRSCFEIKK